MSRQKNRHSGRKKPIIRHNTQNNYEADPITNLFSKLMKNKITLIKQSIIILASVFFAISFFTLHLWGVKFEYILHMFSKNPFDYSYAIPICFFLTCLFTGILELFRRIIKSKKMRVMVYIAYSLICSILCALVLQIEMFSLLMIFFFMLTYVLIYLNLIRPHYSIGHRKLAENALNYKRKRYKFQVIIIEFGLVFLHVITVIGLIGNVYSSIPMYHFVNASGSQIVVSSIKDQAIISGFTIEETKSGTRYIILDRGSMQLSRFDTNDFTISAEKLFISGNHID